MDRERFRELLDKEHAWPTDYTFKFIVPEAQLEQVVALLPAVTPTIRPSKKAAYVAVTFVAKMTSSLEVLEVYERAGNIDKLIAL